MLRRNIRARHYKNVVNDLHQTIFFVFFFLKNSDLTKVYGIKTLSEALHLQAILNHKSDLYSLFMTFKILCSR